MELSAISIPRKPYGVILVVTLALIALYHFGGALWRPVKASFTGEKTVAQIITRFEPMMEARFDDLGLLTDGEPLSILAFKEEQRLEVWKRHGDQWAFVKAYPFTGYSGVLGPKLKQGDLQIPEGIYEVEYLNPNSSFHLSMKLDYPNAFDRARAAEEGRTDLGGDIFIHGSNLTVGCIPIGDEAIEELFYLVAKNGFRNTTVVVAPLDFRQHSKFPTIDYISWEEELYTLIENKLDEYPAYEGVCH